MECEHRFKPVRANLEEAKQFAEAFKCKLCGKRFAICRDLRGFTEEQLEWARNVVCRMGGTPTI